MHKISECNIDELVEQLNINKAQGRKSALIIGAGVSASAGIPLATDIVEEIQKKYKSKYENKKPTSYAEHMKMITPIQRKEMINEFIKKSKVNMAHLYMARLIVEKYFDRVLTTNFDTLVSQALAMENTFPGIYDFASTQEFRATDTAEISIFHLHGQKDGYKLLNTDNEVNKIFENSKKLFEDTLQNRTIVVIGYSGNNDPVFKHLEQVEHFNHNLFWVGYEENDPDERIIKGILGKDNYSHYIRNYNADTFFIELLNKLEVSKPRILENPFTLLLETINNLAELNEGDKKINMADETKKWVKTCIRTYEKDNMSSDIIETNHEVVKITEEKLSKLARESWINKQWDNYDTLRKNISTTSPENIKEYYWNFLSSYGVSLGSLAKQKTGKESENLYKEAIEKFKEAIEIKPDIYQDEVHYNLGVALAQLATLKTGEESERLYRESIEKFKRAIEIRVNYRKAYYNWGTSLANLAEQKTGEESENLYKEAIEKYKKAIEIKPDDHLAYYNWGACLGKLAGEKTGEESERLYKESFEKYKKAIEIKPDDHEAYYNWGTCLGKLAGQKKGEESERLYKESFEKYKKAIEIKPDIHEAYNNWGNALMQLAKKKKGEESERLYKESFEKFKKAIEIKPDMHEAYYNLGTNLGRLAEEKKGEESERLYKESFEKFKKAIEIKPDMHKAYYNWGNALMQLAKKKKGEESERLYKEAIEKFKEAIEIKPDMHEAYYNWGNALMQLAKKKTGEESESLYKEAKEILNKGVQYGGDCYNLACVYSLTGEEKDAFNTLEKSLIRGEISVDYVLNDDDWKEYKNNPKFLEIIQKYKKV